MPRTPTATPGPTPTRPANGHLRSWQPVDTVLGRVEQPRHPQAATVRVVPRSAVNPAVATAVYLIRSVLLGELPAAELETAIEVLLDLTHPHRTREAPACSPHTPIRPRPASPSREAPRS